MATPRELLATALKQSRLNADYTSHSSLSKKIHVSRPVISKAENPSQAVPSDALLVSWARATGADLGTLRDLATRCKSGTPDWFMPYLSAESLATILRCWSPVVVPGLLQCESYARAMLAAEPYTPARLEELVKARMARQQALDRAHLVAILDQSVPQRMIGSPQAMAEQCSHLVALAERPNISLHMVPENTNTGVWYELDIATRDNMATVCLPTLRDVTSTAPDLVDNAMQVFERILGYAMPCGDSLDFLRTQEDQWKARI